MAALVSALVLIAALVTYSYQQTEEQVRQVRVDCQKEHNVPEEVIDRAENGEFTDNKDFKCFTKCFYTKLGYTNDAGDTQVDVIKENIPEPEREKGYKALESCKDSKETDPCEKVFHLHKCYYEQMGTDLERV